MAPLAWVLLLDRQISFYRRLNPLACVPLRSPAMPDGSKASLSSPSLGLALSIFRGQAGDKPGFYQAYKLLVQLGLSPLMAGVT
jgi:hypothetical protein